VKFVLKRGRLLGSLLGVASLLAFALPVAAEAPAAVPADGVEVAGKPMKVTITVSDSGFDKTDYTVYKYESPYKDYVTIVNAGALTHTATLVPGQNAAWMFTCFPSCDRKSTNDRKGKQYGIFDTGGLTAGEDVSGAFINTGTYRFTSATDCMNGNKTPGFDCTPVTIHVKSFDSGSLADAVNGTAMLAPTRDNLSKCVSYRPMSDGGPALCFQSGWTAGRIAGSEKHPLSGNVTVHIDDVNGYDPAQVFVTPDTTVTWVNDSKSRAHSITKNGPLSDRYNGFDPLESPGIGPGESWSYVPCSAASLKICKHDFQYQENTAVYQIPWNWAGAHGSDAVAFVGEVTVVAPR
jgi:plastocyanin